MPNSRVEQKRQTRELLIQTALKLFAEKGILAVSTMDIAKTAEVSHGTVFAHFPTREDLLAAVIADFGERVAKRIHELARDGGGLRETMQLHLSGLCEYENFYTRLINEMKVLPTEARDAVLLIQSAVSIHMAEAAKRAVDEGRIRPMPFDFLFNLWLGLIHHYLANGDLFAPGQSVLERYGLELVDRFMALLSISDGQRSDS